MNNYKLTIEYDGSCYHGYQIQEDLPTIQGCLESVISKIAGEEIKITAAGRTDAGVHALAQVINFRSGKLTVPLDRIPLALNSNLPRDIRVITAELVPDDFHARYDATKKLYIYRLYLSGNNTVFYRNYTWCLKSKVNIPAMVLAGKLFEGTHDFAAFAASGSSVKSTVRTIYSVEVIEDEEMIELQFLGNGFLYRMVRNMVGTLVEVGMGKREPESIADILLSCDRSQAGITAPAEGLFLERVWYKEST